jgi:hypothetical protein
MITILFTCFKMIEILKCFLLENILKYFFIFKNLFFTSLQQNNLKLH